MCHDVEKQDGDGEQENDPGERHDKRAVRLLVFLFDIVQNLGELGLVGAVKLTLFPSR